MHLRCYSQALLLCFPANDLKGKLGKVSYLEEGITEPTDLADGESAFKVRFDWNDELALPGALIVRNEHHNEFYLRTVTLKDVPGHGNIHFLCNSWVYPADVYQKDRIFFTNKVISYDCQSFFVNQKSCKAKLHHLYASVLI